MLYFKAFILEQTKTDFGVVPKTQEYYVPALNYKDAENIFKELINQDMICQECVTDEGKKMFELKKILKEEFEDVIGNGDNFYYKVGVKFTTGEGNKSSTANFYVSNEDANVYDKMTKHITKVGYLCDAEIVSIVKKDRIKWIFEKTDEDYKSVYDSIVK